MSEQLAIAMQKKDTEKLTHLKRGSGTEEGLQLEGFLGVHALTEREEIMWQSKKPQITCASVQKAVG